MQESKIWGCPVSYAKAQIPILMGEIYARYKCIPRESLLGVGLDDPLWVFERYGPKSYKILTYFGVNLPSWQSEQSPENWYTLFIHGCCQGHLTMLHCRVPVLGSQEAFLERFFRRRPLE